MPFKVKNCQNFWSILNTILILKWMFYKNGKHKPVRLILNIDSIVMISDMMYMYIDILYMYKYLQYNHQYL